MKKCFYLLSVFTLSLSSYLAQAKIGDTFEYGDFSYRVTAENYSDAENTVLANGEVTLVKKATGITTNDISGDYVIPEKVYNGDNVEFTVTAISGGYSYSFMKTKITSVTIPSTILSIGSEVFSGCDLLTQVNFSEGLQTIGAEAFYGCAIEELILPESVTKIGQRLFSDCENLKTVHYGANLKTIGEVNMDNTSYFWQNNAKAYYGEIQGCSQLETITVSEENPYFCSYKGNVYTKDLKTLVHVVKQSDRTGEVVIDDGVEFFYCGLFSHHDGITSVVLPSSVKALSRQLFSSCPNLESINMEDTQIETIGWECFTNTCKMKEVNLPSTLKIIDARAFSNWDSLRVIKIPNSCIYIGGRGLKGNPMYAHVTLPSWIETFGSLLFSMSNIGDSKISEVTIPAYVNDNNYMTNYTGEKEPSFGPGNALKSIYIMGDHIPNFIFYSHRDKDVYVKKSVFDDKYPEGSSTMTIKSKTTWGSTTTKDYTISNISYRVPITMTNASGEPIEYKTLCRDFDVDLTHTNDNLPEGVEPLRAYVVENVDGEQRLVFLNEIRYIPSRLKANVTDEDGNLYQGVDEYVGVILRGTPGYTYYYEIGEHDYTQGADGQWLMEDAMAYSGSSFETNLMAGDANDEFYVYKTVLNENNDEIVNYGLNNNRFKIYYRDGWLNYNKSYLQLPKSVSDAVERNSQGEANLTLIFENADGTTDHISSTEFTQKSESDLFFNPIGQRVNSNAKGIIISKGHKRVNR